jgi:hypothetical protein
MHPTLSHIELHQKKLARFASTLRNTEVRVSPLSDEQCR